MRLDSNIMKSGFEPDDETLNAGVESSFMDIGVRHKSIVRKVRDHKGIQVDLVMADAITEAENEEDSEFTVKKLVIERLGNGDFAAKVQVVGGSEEGEK